MDPANSNSRSPQDDVIAARKKWPDYCRLAFTSFRDKIYSAMSRSTVHRYAAHMQDMFQLTKSIDAFEAHANERNKIRFYIKRHRDQSLLVAMAHLKSHAAARRGSAAAQRLRHGKILAKSRQARPARIRFGSSRPAGHRSFKPVKSSSAAAELAPSRQHTASAAEPAATKQQTASEHTEKSNSHEDELAQLRRQLARVTSDLEKFSSAAPDVAIPSIQEDQDFAQAVQDSLGEAALSPARSRTTEQDDCNEAQDQLSDQLAVMAAAKERSLQRFGAEKDIWDDAMHRRYMPAGDASAAPAPAEDANAETAAGQPLASAAASLLSAAKENTAFRPSAPAHERLAGLADSSAAFGPGLQHIINSVPTGGQSSDLQLLMQEIASLKNEVLIIKNTKPAQPAAGLQSDFASLEFQIMRIIDGTHVDIKFEDFVLTQDVLKSCLRPGCTAVQIPGSLTCVCAAPRNMLDFKCPDPSCGMRQAGSVTAMLIQYDCRHCFLRLPWSEPDPAVRSKIRQAIKSSTPPVFDTDPPLGLKSVFWTKHKITQAEDCAVMLIRSGNSSGNYMVAPDATSVKQIVGAIYEGAKAASRNNIFGIKIKSMHNAKIVLGLAKFKIGKRKGDLTPDWHIEVTELVSRAASHVDSTMEWSTQVLEVKPVEFNVDAPSAILILHEMFRGMTEYMCVFLGDGFAHEHHSTTELLIAAHYAEADALDGVHVHFSIEQIITLYHDSTHRYGNIVEAHVNKSPFLHQHYEGDLLWSHIGTSACRPKYFIRSIVQGIPAWNPHIQITFFTSAQIAFRAGIQAAVEAGKPAAALPAPASAPLPAPASAPAGTKAQADRIKKLEQQLAQKDAGVSGSAQPVRITPGSDVPIPELQEFIDNNKHPVSMAHAHFKYPDEKGKWTAVKLDDFCPRCFRQPSEHSNPSNAAAEHKCSYDPSPNAPVSAGGKLHWNLEVVSKVVALSPDKRVAAYKYAAKKRRERLKAKKANAEGDESGSLSPEEQLEYSAFQAGDAVASEMIQQPTIAGFRATLSVSEKTAPEQGLKLDHSTDIVNSVRRIQMGVPSLATEAIIEVLAKAFCVGMDVDTPSGVQHHRCGFKAIAAQVRDLLSSTLFAEVLESSIRFLDAVGELEERFEHLAAAEVVEVFLMRGISCHDAIFARHQPTSMFWLRTAFPRCLGKRPVLVTYVHEGLLRFQLYICAAGPEYTSELSSEVVHILVHEVHSYILDWECDWSSLDKVLLSLGKLHRFADVGINLCNTIERTLEAAMPTAPDYLKGAEMLTSVLDARLPEKDSGTYTAPVHLSVEQRRSLALRQVDADSFVKFEDQISSLADSTVVSESFTQPVHDSHPQSAVAQQSFKVPAVKTRLIMDLSSGSNCSSVNELLFLSSAVFRASDACTGGSAVAAFNTFCGWLDHHSIVGKFWYGSCRNSRFKFSLKVNSGCAASFTINELRRRISTTVCSPVCACQQCSETHCSGNQVSARSPLPVQQLYLLHPYSQHASPPLNLVYRLRGGDVLVDDRVVTLPASQCSEVLDTIISSNLAYLTVAPYDGSVITITEENLFMDSGSNFQELQAVRNVRAALTNEYLICRKMGIAWESCTAPIVDLLREVFIISRLQQPIRQLVSIMAKLMRTNVSSRQSLAHCRWIMAAAARAWSRSLTTEFCCTLRPSLAYYSRLVEKVANIHPLSLLDGFIDLSFLATVAQIGNFDIKRVWIMLAVRMSSSHEQSLFVQDFNACAPQLSIAGTPEAAAHESSDEFDMSAATQSQILEQWSAYCSTIGLHSELLEAVDHRGQASMAAFATAFISRLIQCTVITPELAVPTLDIIDSHHVNRGVNPPFCGNDFVTSGLDDIFEKLATADDFELSPSPVEPYPRYEIDVEPESPQSESMSPIAARKVDMHAEPLDRYREALLRNHQGSESHESWRLRVTDKFFQARSNHRFSFRDRASRSQQASTSPTSASPMMDDSSSLSEESYEHELQGALGVGPSELAMVLYTGHPAAAPPEGHVAEFHNALPQEMRLPSSAEVQGLAAGRTNQSTITFCAVKSADFRPRRTADRR